MEDSRRHFLKVMGNSAIGLSACSLIGTVAVSKVTASSGGESSSEGFSKGPDALKAHRWGLVIDTRKLKKRVVHKMIEACHKAHNVPDHENKRHEIKWIWETEFKHAFPNKEDEYLAEDLEKAPIPVLCNHCDNPPCVQACPTQATFKREEDGLVLMDFHRCIGCRFCIAACPFGARSFNFVDPRTAIKHENPEFPTRTKGVVEKCNFCAERLAVGKAPACVEASKGALVYGDLEDPKSEVRKLLKEHYAIRRKQSLGTNPSVYYIV